MIWEGIALFCGVHLGFTQETWRLGPCASSIVFIFTFDPWMTSTDKKVIHHFFHGWHFYPWIRFFHPWMFLMDENFIQDKIFSSMDGIFICHVLGWKLEKKYFTHSHLCQNSHKKIQYLGFKHKTQKHDKLKFHHRMKGFIYRWHR